MMPLMPPHAYAVFGRPTSDQEFDLPSAADLLWAEGALGALLAYMDEYMEMVQGVVQPADFTVSVLRVEGEAEVHFRLLEFEAIFQEDLDE